MRFFELHVNGVPVILSEQSIQAVEPLSEVDESAAIRTTYEKGWKIFDETYSQVKEMLEV